MAALSRSPQPAVHITTDVRTDERGGGEADRGVGRLALGEERLAGVERRAERHDGHGAGPHYQALGPESQPGQHRPERHLCRSRRHSQFGGI